MCDGGMRMSTMTMSGCCSRTTSSSSSAFAGPPDDVEARAFEQAGQPLEQEDLVVRQHHARQISHGWHLVSHLRLAIVEALLAGG